MSAVFDVAVNDKLGVGAEMVAKFDDIWDKFIVSGDFTHFFFGAEMDGEGGRVLGEQGGQPSLKFVDSAPAEAGFDGNWKRGGVLGISKTFDSKFGRLDHGGTATSAVDILVGTAKVQIDTSKAELLKSTGALGEMVGVFAPDLSDDRSIGRGDFEARESVTTAFFRGVG